jgi:hypothetical protein
MNQPEESRREGASEMPHGVIVPLVIRENEDDVRPLRGVEEGGGG